MQLDKKALEAARYMMNRRGYAAPDDVLRRIIQAYLAALPKPEGVPVRVCVAVAKDGGADVYDATLVAGPAPLVAIWLTCSMWAPVTTTSNTAGSPPPCARGSSPRSPRLRGGRWNDGR